MQQNFWDQLLNQASGLASGLWVVILAAWGGAIRYHSLKPEPFSWLEMLWEISTSAFVGVVVYLGCAASGFSTLLTAAIVGVAGHMGGIAMQMIGKWILGRAGIGEPKQ